MKRAFLLSHLAAAVGLIAGGACGTRGAGSSLTNPCLQQNGGCDPHAMCANNNGVPVCTCHTGYAGNGYNCVDVDECGDHSAYCDPNATCANGAGTYTCTCNAGWTGNGTSCTPVDGGPIADAGPGVDDAGEWLDAGPTVDAGEGEADAGATFDAGIAADAGAPIPDAGPGVDAGQTPDAGRPTDAGHPTDAGETEADAGAPDAGSAVDAGPGPDAGTPYDAGTITLASDTVTARIQIDPSELQWRGQLSTWTPPGVCESGQAADGTVYDPDAGTFPSTPPCLAGDSVQIVDQVRQWEGGGPLGAGGVTAWSGEFEAPRVDLVDTDLGLLAVVTDPAGLIAPSAGIVALPPFSSRGVSGTPIYVVSVALMQHIAAVIGMSYDSMMSKGVALIHVTGTPDGQPVFEMFNVPEGTIAPPWVDCNPTCTGNTYEEYLTPGSSFPPYVFFLGSNLDGVLAYNSEDIPVTSSAGLVVVVEPQTLLYPPDAGTYETGYTCDQSGYGDFAIFGDEPNAVVDVSIPSE